MFQTTPGRLQFDLTILQADGTKLDVGAQDFDVPNVRGANPVILPPQMLSAASAREFRDISADANAAPLPGREFRRTERLLLRIPTFEPAGNAVRCRRSSSTASAPCLTDSRRCQTRQGRTLTQFDLPLARFAPGEYSIEVAAPQRRRDRPRADPLPNHGLTVSLLAHAPGPRAQPSPAAVRFSASRAFKSCSRTSGMSGGIRAVRSANG